MPSMILHPPSPMLMAAHVFKCAACGCKFTSRRYLDTKDKSSTGNLVRHAKGCWGEECWAAAGACHTAEEARESVTNPYNQSGSITASFARKGKGKVTYSHKNHTKTETKYTPTLHQHSLANVALHRAEIVRWVAESNRPFRIVEDRGFQSLMKTGRPEYYIPSASTVSRDVRLVFARTRQRIAKILQVCS